jgi:hypothetical protein
MIVCVVIFGHDTRHLVFIHEDLGELLFLLFCQRLAIQLFGDFQQLVNMVIPALVLIVKQ